MYRDYGTISPSALSLLKLKAHTSIPFAKKAAILVEKHGSSSLPENLDEQLYYWLRVFHFESRYASINDLLSDIHPKNILELSAGYSFRGLDYCLHHNIHYIDTDLREVISLKTNLRKELVGGNVALKGKLDMIALNVLDEAAFDEIVTRFNDNPLIIVNEGLLMYLKTDEKKKLCGIIHKHLLQKGGYWITADIYIQSPESNVKNLKMSKEQEDFFARHNIDENKFVSESAANEFFKSQGFVVDKVANVDAASLSAYHKLVQYVPEEIRLKNKAMPKIQSTWRLKAI